MFEIDGMMGMICPSTSATTAFDVWLSADGRKWSRVQVPGKPADLPRANIIVVPSGILVAGSLKKDSGTMTVWSSADARTWNGHELMTGAMTIHNLLTPVGDGYLLTARVIESTGLSERAWTSADGANWDAVTDLSEDFHFDEDVIAHDGGLVSVSGYGIRVSGLDW